jgi:hypothetical protein
MTHPAASRRNRSRKFVFLAILGVLLGCATAIAAEARFKVAQRAYDNFALDNRNHYLSCQDLPFKSEVERIVGQHQDTIEQIEQVAPGSVGVEIDDISCPARADLLIWYGTHQERVAIEKIIGADTFFGVPYRLQNR